MTKIRDQYLSVDPWKIIEHGFHADRSQVSESLFSLANEHQGVRGYFDEGYSGESLVGVYLNGIYEERFTEAMSYKGISNRLCFMVNTVNWLYTRLELNGETLDLASSKFSEFRRELDFRSGVLRREFVWETGSGKRLQLVFLRLLSMETEELACQQIRITPLNFSGRLTLTMGLDFSMPHRMFAQNFWECPRQAAGAILGVSKNMGQHLFAGMRVEGQAEQTLVVGEKFSGVRLEVNVTRGQERVVGKSVILHTDRDPHQPLEIAWERGLVQLNTATKTYAQVLNENRMYWNEFWTRSDITIDGDPETQQGIRFCIFQLQQTYRGAVDGANIGAKGLTGEAYNGNAFWDTETYCLPFYLFSNPAAAKSLLDFRYKTLRQAMERAKDLDCRGACYPVATIDGTESCTLWQHASLQFQPTTAVAYAIAHYVNVTGDVSFLKVEGARMLIEICRFLASRGQWSAKGKFGYYAVMGPDEFQMMVNHNTYTNYMARRTFEFTLKVLAEMDLEALGCTRAELNEWRRMATEMLILHGPESGLYEQHEGFFSLPHIDIDAIPAAEFPLYEHWSYDRIYRNDMIKQPDVLMFMLLYNGSFSLAEKRANYDYYEPRCIHESSLSPSVHSILASELGRPREAFDFFRFATRIDLDNYNRNTHEGIHTTSIAAAWMNIVYGFGGMRSDGEILSFSPSIPAHWKGYSFQVFYRDSILRVEVSQFEALIRVVDGSPVRIQIGGQDMEVTQHEISIPLRDRVSTG
ncbi:MAG TPA: glycosyl hydrolase family 65 protein [Anaerolineales bacterium]|nr:glycosyl hydrolase family 65 protein [Anaerolineales bacterium]